MKAFAIAAICLSIIGCAATPKQFEDEHVILLDGTAWVKDADQKTPDEIRAIGARYTVPVIDEAERKACRRVLWGQGADMVTTGVVYSLSRIAAIASAYHSTPMAE